MSRFLAVAFAILMLGFSPRAFAAEPGESMQTEFAGSSFVGGGEVRLRADVPADLLAMGGHIEIDRAVGRDLLAMGGSIDVTAPVSDNARLLAGRIRIGATIGNDLSAAAGTIAIVPGATIGGDAALYGGDVEIGGAVSGNLHVRAGHVVLDGAVDGDVDLTGRDIEIGPHAVIGGKLTTRGGEPAIDAAAKIGGGVSATVAPPRPEHNRPAWPYHLGRRLGILIIGALFILIFPSFAGGAAGQLRAWPGRSLGIGVAIAVVTPLLFLLLCATLLGIPLALTLLLAFALSWLLAYFVAAMTLAEFGCALIKRPTPDHWFPRLVVFLVAMIALMAIRQIPFLGPFVILIALLFALGAAYSRLFEAQEAEPVRPRS